MAMNEINSIAAKLKQNAFKGDIKPLNPRQKVMDEDLLKLFSAIEGSYYETEVLKEHLEGIIKVNDKDPSKSVVSSTYLRRLSRFSGKRWRQKKAKAVDGKLLVKFYISGKYVEKTRKK